MVPLECCICLLAIEEEVHHCPKCKTMLICKTCLKDYKQKLCPTCRQPVLKKDYTRNIEAETQIIAYKNSICPKHQGQNMRRNIFCVNCQVSVCDECFVESHFGHKRKRVTIESDSTSKRLKLALTDLEIKETQYDVDLDKIAE